MSDVATTPLEKRFPCAQCGAKLEYAPGTATLTCPYCSAENEIPAGEAVVEEEDFHAALEALEGQEDHQDCMDVKCESCGAHVHGLGSKTALSCPYCGSNIVATAKSRRLIKPKALLPFAITREGAQARFTAWLASLWFAPGDLKKTAHRDGTLTGIYMPAWTYDCDATTSYTGQRGDAYYVTVPYTTVVNGKTVRGTRQERRIRWRPASGTVRNHFDDVLVLASGSLPRDEVEPLEPWDLKALAPYDDAYLSGFAAESYQTDLKGGWDRAREIMRPTIALTVRGDIGGDEQRITSMHTSHAQVRFKHILLPLWISAYRYRGKIYRFMVNARTGEVRGQRPWSATKIAGAVIAGLLVVAAVALVIAARR